LEVEFYQSEKQPSIGWYFEFFQVVFDGARDYEDDDTEYELDQ